MASSMRAGRVVANKENRALAGKEPELETTRSATPKRKPCVPVARQATAKATPKAAAKVTTSSARTGATSRSNAASNRNIPLTQQVENGKVELKKLEEEIEAMQIRADNAEADAIEEENAMLAAQQELTSRTAEMLKDYTARCETIAALEAEVAEVQAKLKAQRAKNLELSARNLELDREGRAKKQSLDSAKAELERISKSQGELDAELERQYEHCERIKRKAGLQAESHATDWKRMDTMSKRLSEVAGSCPSEEVQQLLSQAADRMRKAKDAQIFLENLAREGPQPQPTTWEAAE